MPRYVVRPTEAERQILEGLLSKGRHAVTLATRARILLKAGRGWTDGGIVRALDTSLSTARRAQQEFVESGLEAALRRRQATSHRPRKLDGAEESRARWTLKLLAQRMVELEVVPSLSAECVRTTLKKTNPSPG